MRPESTQYLGRPSHAQTNEWGHFHIETIQDLTLIAVVLKTEMISQHILDTITMVIQSKSLKTHPFRRTK